MNQLLESGKLQEIECGRNFAYILAENAEFLSTDYKVLQSQQNNNFIPCMRMFYNGKTQLFYLVSDWQSLEALLPKLNAEAFITVVTNLLAAIVDVKNNGFLSVENININRTRLYVDPNTLKVSLVYVPTATSAYGDAFIFENELRTSLIKIINEMPNLQSNRTFEFANELSNGSTSLEDLYHYLKGGNIRRQPEGGGQQFGQQNMAPQGLSRRVNIIAMNAPTRVEISVNKNDFILGKGSMGTDAIISFNPAISRKHCKISEQNRQIFVTDLKSANGTYLNREKLMPNQPYPLSNGDVIRMANSDFQVIIG